MTIRRAPAAKRAKPKAADKREKVGKTPLDPTRPIGKGNPPTETQIKPGQVLNPHGRPRKLADLQALIKDTLAEEVALTDPDGHKMRLTRAQAMIRTMLVKSPSDRIALLEYAFGKVPQAIMLSKLSDDELFEYLAAADEDATPGGGGIEAEGGAAPGERDGAATPAAENGAVCHSASGHA